MVIRRRRGAGKEFGSLVHDDHISCDFTAQAANKLWLTDIAEQYPGEGRLCQCPDKDVYAKRIVGDSINSWMEAPLAADALKEAISQLDPQGTALQGAEARYTGPRRPFI